QSLFVYAEPKSLGTFPLSREKIGLANPYSMVYDKRRGELWVGGTTSNNVVVVDVATRKPVAAIADVVYPYLMVMDKSRDRIYVNNFANGWEVVVIDAATRNKIGKIKTTSEIVGMALSDDASGDLFVANRAKNPTTGLYDVFLTRFNPDTLIASGSKELPFHPKGLIYVNAIYVQGGKVHTMLKVIEEAGAPGAGYIHITDAKSMIAMQSVALGAVWPSGMTFDVTDKTYYVTDMANHRIEMFRADAIGNLKSLGTIAGLSSPWFLTLDASSSRLYAPDNFANKIWVIDTVKKQIIKSLEGGYDPSNAIYDDDKGLVYVVNYLSHDVSVIDSATSESKGTIDLRSYNPYDIAIDKTTGEAYVTTGFTNGILKWDMTQLKPLGFYQDYYFNPAESALLKQSNKLVYRSTIYEGSSSLRKLNLLNNNVGPMISKLWNVGGIEGMPALNKFLVTSRTNVTGASNATYWKSYLHVVDAVSESIDSSYPIGLSTDFPTKVAYAAGSGKAYVCLYAAREVAIVDLNAAGALKRIKVGFYPNAIAVNDKTQRVYVTNYGSNSLSVIDMRTDTIIATIDLGHAPYDVAVMPATNNIYVAYADDGLVGVWDGDTNTLRKDFTVGRFPHRIRIDASRGRVLVANYSDASVTVIEDAPTPDVIAPVITHKPVIGVVPSSAPVVIAAQVNDDKGVAAVTLTYWNASALTPSYITVAMGNTTGSSYEAKIPEAFLAGAEGAKIAYFIDATDFSGNGPPTGSVPGSAKEPNSFEVKRNVVLPVAPLGAYSGWAWTSADDLDRQFSWQEVTGSSVTAYRVYVKDPGESAFRMEREVPAVLSQAQWLTTSDGTVVLMRNSSGRFTYTLRRKAVQWAVGDFSFYVTAVNSGGESLASLQAKTNHAGTIEITAVVGFPAIVSFKGPLDTAAGYINATVFTQPSSYSAGSKIVSNSAATVLTLDNMTLTPGVTYYLQVYKEVSSGGVQRVSLSAAKFKFIQSVPELPPAVFPVISDIRASSIGIGYATVTWHTDLAADSQVIYGTTTAYGQVTPLASAMLNNHSVRFGGLATARTYHFRVRSRDAAGNLAVSEDATFYVPTQLAITSPVGSTDWTRGATVPIRWTGGDPSWNTINIQLVGTACWCVVKGIAGGLPNNGSYDWTVDVSSQIYQIYIEGNRGLADQNWVYGSTFSVIGVAASVPVALPVVAVPSSLSAGWSWTSADDLDRQFSWQEVTTSSVTAYRVYVKDPGQSDFRMEREIPASLSQAQWFMASTGTVVLMRSTSGRFAYTLRRKASEWAVGDFTFYVTAVNAGAASEPSVQAKVNHAGTIEITAVAGFPSRVSFKGPLDVSAGYINATVFTQPSSYSAGSKIVSNSTATVLTLDNMTLTPGITYYVQVYKQVTDQGTLRASLSGAKFKFIQSAVNIIEPPRVSILVPSPGQMFNSPVTVSGVAVDPADALSVIEFSLLDKSDGRFYTASGFTVSESWVAFSGKQSWSHAFSREALRDGVYLLKVRAKTTDGRVSQVAEAGFTFDTTAPLTQAKIDGAKGLEDYYVSMATVTLLASDAVAGVEATRYRTGQSVDWMSSAVPFMLTDGRWQLAFYSRDHAGNEEQPKTMEVAVDMQSPKATIESFSAKAAAGSAWDSVSGVSRIDASLYDKTSGLYWNGEAFVVGMFWIDAGSGNTWSLTMPALASAHRYELSVRAVDRAGRVQETPERSLYLHDGQPPVSEIRVFGPSIREGFYTGPVDAVITSKDDIAGVDKVMVRIDEGAWRIYEGTVTISASGTHQIEFYGVDFKGNAEAVKSRSVSIDAEGPRIVILKPQDGGSIVSGELLIVAGNAQDQHSGLDGIAVGISEVGTPPGSPVVPAIGPDGAWKVEFANLKGEKKYAVAVSAVDKAGNKALSQVTVNVTKRLGKGVANITVPTEGKRLRGNAVTLMADANAATAAVLFQYRSDFENAWVNVTTLDQKHPFSVYWNTSGLVNGKYWLRAVAFDVEGLSDPDPKGVSVFIDDVNTDVHEDGNPEVNPNNEHRKIEKVDASAKQDQEVAMADGTKAVIPSGVVKQNDQLEVRVVNESEVKSKLPVLEEDVIAVGVYREFNFGSGAKKFDESVVLHLPYPDENGDGTV
ncbi:MAG: hypothetical protein AABZ44_00310, partial [Elusimicrobiota bacterium]